MTSDRAIELKPALGVHFGFDAFKPGQEEVMTSLMEGHSAAAVFPTGAGKSLCYQLPALLLPGLTVVVSPLISLMKDQLDVLIASGKAAARLDSSLSRDEYRDTMQRLRNGALKLLYVAPERFNNEMFRNSIKDVQISLFAIDEAHCVSEWGHNFRPDYLKLADFAKSCRAERILALTATATPKVIVDMCKTFQIEPQRAVCTGFYRPNLTMLIRTISDEQRDDTLLEYLINRPKGSTIVYVTRQKTAVRVSAMIDGHGFSSKPYHAGMKNEDRNDVQDWFMASDDGVVVATIAFGMGVDKRNIRYVYHYNQPGSLENYAQEIGRAGRDNEPSTCQMFVCPNDLPILENFAYGDTPSKAGIAGLIKFLFSSGSNLGVSYSKLAFDFDIRILVVRTLLTYLELDGYLESGTPYYSTYRFNPLMSSEEILGKFKGERRQFLNAVLAQSVRAKKWFDIDLEAAAQAIGTSRERIVKALDYLAEQGMMELQVTGLIHRYTVLKTPSHVESLINDLYARMIDREQKEITRIHQVIDLALQDGCIVSRLGAHFGDPLDKPCGHCSRCLGDMAPSPFPTDTISIDATIWEKATALQQKHPQALGTPRALTRFLCGVTSPKNSRARLGSNSLFGALSHVPFTQVLEQAR